MIYEEEEAQCIQINELTKDFTINVLQWWSYYAGWCVVIYHTINETGRRKKKQLRLDLHISIVYMVVVYAKNKFNGFFSVPL